MKIWRACVAGALAVSLSACALGTGDGVAWRPDSWCLANTAKILKQADWSKAQTINLKFMKKFDADLGYLKVYTDVFEPQFLAIKKGNPYILKVENTDSDFHSLSGYDFFADMAIAKIVNAGVKSDLTCISAVTIPEKKSAEIHFVAAKSGQYELEDNAFLLMPGLGSVAFITIK
jgi:hypothetical protein